MRRFVQTDVETTSESFIKFVKSTQGRVIFGIVAGISKWRPALITTLGWLFAAIYYEM